jgi:uncharacterized membrane protein SpoIIM required for sporulation
MSNMALIYWLTRLSSISNLFFGLGMLSGIFIFVGLLAYTFMIMDFPSDEDEIEYKQKRKKFFNKIWVPILFFVLNILTPNTKEAMLIIAGGKTLDYVQSDTALQKIPYKATELILKKMEDYIDETTKDSTKTK